MMDLDIDRIVSAWQLITSGLFHLRIPPLKNPPLIDSDFELRGDSYPVRRRRKIFRIFWSKMMGNPLEIHSKSTPKPLKITVFDCILKQKTPKFFRLRRAITTVATDRTVLLTHHTNSFLESKFLHLLKLRNARAWLSNVLRMVNACSYARENSDNYCAAANAFCE